MLIFPYICKKEECIMDQLATTQGNMVNEKLETAINLGCTMFSRTKEVRKKLGSQTEDNASLKKSLKELDKMSVELVDRLIEINARMNLTDKENNEAGTKSRVIRRSWLGKMGGRFLKRLENMRLTYQDIYTL
jgi:predicted RNase H-like nuclease (RuvC/YqgF family)